VSRKKFYQIALYSATTSLHKIEKRLNDNIRRIEPYSRRKKQIRGFGPIGIIVEIPRYQTNGKIGI